jgi:hypothetical protein
MTTQEIFDTVATHLFTQGERALSADGACMYRAPDGRKCAAGVLIDDNEYNPAMEGTTFGGGRHGDQRLSHLWPMRLVQHINLITTLQTVHDANDNDYWLTTDRMKWRLRKVAILFDLDPKVLDNLQFEGR